MKILFNKPTALMACAFLAGALSTLSWFSFWLFVASLPLAVVAGKMATDLAGRHDG